jgi:hypothetical protein
MFKQEQSPTCKQQPTLVILQYIYVNVDSREDNRVPNFTICSLQLFFCSCVSEVHFNFVIGKVIKLARLIYGAINLVRNQRKSPCCNMFLFFCFFPDDSATHITTQ